ncbi:hypothetical protein BcepIL02_gp15 [Burkholderia phage BcepIL02]|uniref:Uncharacterized protein n=1 Tax=Burkholderia phage BcepIL02 TaxID=2886898 RepID=C5IHK7_9CAUD|nr:hypothetical protein BcepIL02_gp15 [Burkholderia phage BcepIL02]ACR15008.1 hypothetical protein BcepIL02_gp15 [Burkholderia phage BcepIL02]
MSEITPTFHGEMQLAGWSETHTGGCKVTFWLPDPSDLEAFRTLTVRKGNQAGHRFMVAMVEIGDDEQPVQQPAGPAPAPERPKGGALARLAGMWCNDEEFWTWVRSLGQHCESADDAARFVRHTCGGIESRAELDSNAVAEGLFQERIRSPFMLWRRREAR